MTLTVARPAFRPVVRTPRTGWPVRTAPVFVLGGALPRPVDVTTTDEAYTLSVELPGVKREDITLELTEDTLAVRSERLTVRRTVPADVDREQITASVADGVLRVTLPRVAAPEPRQIEIAAV